MTEIRADMLTPDHIGQEITVPIGINWDTLTLHRLSFRKYDGILRVTVYDVAGHSYDLPAYRIVEVQS